MSGRRGSVDLHIVVLLTLLVVLALATRSFLPRPWAAATIWLVPQGILLTGAFFDRRRLGKPWMGYWLTNEALVLLGGLGVLWL